jgi:hypothetical protein
MELLLEAKYLKNSTTFRTTLESEFLSVKMNRWTDKQTMSAELFQTQYITIMDIKIQLLIVKVPTYLYVRKILHLPSFRLGE